VTETIKARWEFDSYRAKESSVELVDCDGNPNYDQKVRVMVDGKEVFAFEAYRDQWGTYIGLAIGDKNSTIAQEDGTRSFMAALMTALEKFLAITDHETKPPTEIELEPAPCP